MKEKSLNDVMKQLTRIQATYHNGYWVKVAYEIAQHYIDQIETTQKVWGEYRKLSESGLVHKKYEHAVRSFMPDSSLEFIRSLQPWEKKGLYVEIDGEKITPTRLYFGCDTRLFRPDGGSPCGGCYWFYGCALHPVFLPDGTHYREPKLANVCASYKNGIVCDFYRE